MKVIVISLLLISAVVHAQDKPLTPEKLYDRAETEYDAGKYREAIDLLNTALQQKPALASGYFLRASAREQLKDLEGALTDYSIYLSMRADNTEALFNRATIRYQLKKYDQAREDFLQLLRLPPGQTQSVYYNRGATVGGVNQIMTTQGNTRPIVYNYIGMIDLRQKAYKTSIAWLDSAIRLDPKEADYYVNRALARQNTGDSTAALADYNKALAINPRHTMALHNVAVFKGSGKARPEAQDPLERAIDSDSSMLYPYLERAWQRMEGGFYKGALADYTKALEIETKDPEIWLGRGLARERLKDYNGAFADYTQAISLKEDYVKAWINRANVLLKQERYKDAADDYTVALVYKADIGAAYYNRAIARYHLKHAEACADLQRAETLGMKPDPKMKSRICPGN